MPSLICIIFAFWILGQGKKVKDCAFPQSYKHSRKSRSQERDFILIFIPTGTFVSTSTHFRNQELLCLFHTKKGSTIYTYTYALLFHWPETIKQYNGLFACWDLYSQVVGTIEKAFQFSSVRLRLFVRNAIFLQLNRHFCSALVWNILWKRV